MTARALLLLLVIVGTTTVALSATRDYHYQLAATADRIFTNPADYTAFRERRQALAFLQEEGGVDSTGLITKELLWTHARLEASPKNFQVWHHRLEVVKMTSSPPSSSSSFLFEEEGIRAMVEEELSWCRSYLERWGDPKNYHAWGYRRALVDLVLQSDEETVEDKKKILDGEVSLTNEMLKVDSRNNAVWSHRFWARRQVDQLSRHDEEEEKELRYVVEVVSHDPGNESAWMYLMQLLRPLPSLPGQLYSGGNITSISSATTSTLARGSSYLRARERAKRLCASIIMDKSNDRDEVSDRVILASEMLLQILEDESIEKMGSNTTITTTTTTNGTTATTTSGHTPSSSSTTTSVSLAKIRALRMLDRLISGQHPRPLVSEDEEEEVEVGGNRTTSTGGGSSALLTRIRNRHGAWSERKEDLIAFTTRANTPGMRLYQYGDKY